jgi:hypothetical protein
MAGMNRLAIQQRSATGPSKGGALLLLSVDVA